MRLRFNERAGLILLTILVSLLFWSPLSSATEWMNPKELFKDTPTVRLQRGQKELTELEKKEVATYGFTGLELMIYIYCNQEPGLFDRSSFIRFYVINPGKKLLRYAYLTKSKYYYRDKIALVRLRGIKPGDIFRKESFIYLYPPEAERDGGSWSYYLKSKEFPKRGTCYLYTRKIRRLGHYPTPKNEECLYGGDCTWYDLIFKQPWDADYRILGEDTIRGHNCLVVEGRYKIHPNHYNSKRIVWIDKNIFIDVHNEEFDRSGRLYRVTDKDWEQVRPSNWWVYKQWNIINIGAERRTIVQHYDWLIDQNYEDGDFEPSKALEEHVWRKPNPKNLPPLINEVSDLPPEPEIRWEFWDKLKIKPQTAK